MTKRKLNVPHTLVILFAMVVLAQILTCVIPAGQFVFFSFVPISIHHVWSYAKKVSRDPLAQLSGALSAMVRCR